MIFTEKIGSVVHDLAGEMLYAESPLIDRFGFEKSGIVSVLVFHFSQIQLDRSVVGTLDVQHTQQSSSLRRDKREFGAIIIIIIYSDGSL